MTKDTNNDEPASKRTKVSESTPSTAKPKPQPKPKAAKPKLPQDAESKINRKLAAAGHHQPEHSSKCCRKALTKGYIRFNCTPLELTSPVQVVYKGSSEPETLIVYCHCCSKEMTPTLNDLLGQTDVPGMDYENGGSGGSVFCRDFDENGQRLDYVDKKDNEDNEQEDHTFCGATYLSRMCEGDFTPDSGKFSQHCDLCPKLGKCIGGYREAHCGCGKHYFAGMMGGFSCPRCSRGDDGGAYGGYDGYNIIIHIHSKRLITLEK